MTHGESHGRDAIDRTCRETPGAYLRAALSLIPKGFALSSDGKDFPQFIELRFTDDVEEGIGPRLPHLSHRESI